MFPSNITLERVEHPDETFVDDAVRIFASLMDKDPLVVAFTGGDPALISAMCRPMIAPLSLLPGFGDAFAARDEHGKLVGFLLFSLPGQLLFATEESRAFGFYDFIDRLSPEARDFFLEVNPKLPPAENKEQETERASYWCNFAFVRADYQRKGIGSALFELSFKRAAELGEKQMAVVTTNPENEGFYEAIGFDLIDKQTVPTPWNEVEFFLFSKTLEKV